MSRCYKSTLKSVEEMPKKITERYKKKMFRDKIFCGVFLRKYVEQRKRKKRAVLRSAPFDILNATINHYRAKGGADRPRFMILLLSRCPRKQTAAAAIAIFASCVLLYRGGNDGARKYPPNRERKKQGHPVWRYIGDIIKMEAYETLRQLREA